MVSEDSIIPYSRCRSHRLLTRGFASGPYSRVRLFTLFEVAKGHAQLGSCYICIPGNCNPWGVSPASPGNTCGRGCSWDGRTCRAGDDYFSWSLELVRASSIRCAALYPIYDSACASFSHSKREAISMKGP